ncbi:MAG TPA: phosphatase PAP2 family protein [Chthonomonadales bacterium]|nr:phosphatase PAP2 family protein [Chthonomonadales bacterium]
MADLDASLLALLNRGAANAPLDWLMPRITSLHHHFWFLPALALFAVAVLWRGSPRARAWVLCAIAAVALTDMFSYRVIKSWLPRDRPCHRVAGGGFAAPHVRLVPGADCPGSPSFPSNHAANMSALATVGILFGRSRRRWWWLLLPTVIGYSRVYLGYHYPFDMLGGWALGAAVGGLVVLPARRWRAAPATAVRTAVPVSVFLLLGCLAMAAQVAPQAPAGPTTVRLERSGEGWRLVRDGQPVRIMGAGGSGSLAALREAGGNSVRLWDAEGSDAVLDEAHRLGMTVALGIWLGQERQGFRYSDPEQVRRQEERVRRLVERYRSHPAVLLWGLGNEMEGDGSNPAIWREIERLARIVKQLDPGRPVMTVIAEIGGDKVGSLHRYSPSIDIVGINSYAGAASLPERYRRAGGRKPYLLGEFGPPGTWEVGRTPWGAVIEPTSTEKAESYRRAWQAVAADPLCLGGYAFIWGWKQEATATWFGMLLPDGTRLGAVDAMQEAWTGRPPANRSPRIASLRLEGEAEVAPGATVRARLAASDPDGDRLTVTWELRAEAERYLTGGDPEPEPPAFPSAVRRGDARGAEVRMPDRPGAYRLFVVARDGRGSGATANVTLRVRGDERRAPAARLPLVVHDEAGAPNPPYAPSGWMGDAAAIAMQPDSTERPGSGRTSLRFEVRPTTGWAGVLWQNPPGDWGEQPGGWDLTGARRLVFLARGARGGEQVTFQIGGLGRDKPYPDSAEVRRLEATLTAEWTELAIDLAGLNLSRIKTGFGWVVGAQREPLAFFLDRVRFE